MSSILGENHPTKKVIGAVAIAQCATPKNFIFFLHESWRALRGENEIRIALFERDSTSAHWIRGIYKYKGQCLLIPR